MEQFDFCQYADVFYGNGETDRFFKDGLASKWVYIKALCGNTIPHAVLPFGKMSVGAYSGGYPTGYGTHYPSSCGSIRKLGDIHLVKGFSHLHQSGTGAIRFYYNYAITSPFYGNITRSQELRPLKNERARPGYYGAELQDIACELTVDGGVALHRYTFGDEGGRIAVDFSNNGLDKIFGDLCSSDVKDPEIEIISENEAVFSGEFHGVRLFFCVKAEGETAGLTAYEGETELSATSVIPTMRPYGVVFDLPGKTILLRVGYSTVSARHAQDAVQASSVSFDEACRRGYETWNEHLSTIRIDTDDQELKGKFYSNLYHSLVKPVDMTGESVLGVSGDTVTDFATLWDQYKTALPLIYLCYADMGEKIAKGIVNISRSLGKIPCSFGLADVYPCEEQAKMLGVLALCDAFHMGVQSATVEVIEECIARELERDDYASFLKDGIFDRYTHILDVTDACLCVARITGDDQLKKRLLALSENWRNAYAEDGLMSERSLYYEGDRYNYSFRIQKNMEERVALAGGKERFARLLDEFFGLIEDSGETQRHRFEGFNNETDMETPYAYIYADRHDRLCEIIHECVSRSFGLGTGGLPGNNDSGGLSSLFVWNALGIFPAGGNGDFLIGAPQVNGADITLANRNTLCIRVEREHTSECPIYVDRVEWNGKAVEDWRISVQELIRGGTLQFYMK